MQTKSNIQLVKENLQAKDAFRKGLKNFMEKYTIENSVFTFDGNKVNEESKGYFAITGEYNSIDEAIPNYNLGESIRIVNNELFQTGKVYNRLSSIPSDIKKVYDFSSKEIHETE